MIKNNFIYIRYDQIHKIDLIKTNSNKTLLHILNNLLIKDINKNKNKLIINSYINKHKQLRIELKYNINLFDNIPIKTYIIISKDQQLIKKLKESLNILINQIELKYRYIAINNKYIYVDQFIKKAIKKNKYYIKNNDSLNSYKYVNHLYINDLINNIKYNKDPKELKYYCNKINEYLNII